MKRFCPFTKKECRKDCVLFRSGVRYFDDKSKEPIPFEECALNIAVDCLENMISRSIGQQQSTEGIRNKVASLQNFLENLAIGKVKEIEDGTP